MNRRTAGLLLAVLGFGMVAVGLAGALLDDGDGGAPVPAASTDPTGTPSASPTVTGGGTSELAGVAADRERDLFVCGSDESAPGAPAHLDVVRASVREGTNPATNEPSTNLLLDLAAAAADPAVSFEARVAVAPGGAMPQGVQAVEWRLRYSEGAFQREASVLRGDTPEPGPIEDFRVRYEGLGDRVEIEFYGPPGTRYFGAATTDGTVCDVVVPD